MKFGYARVSKNEQSLDVQIQKLTAAGCDEIFQEKISGAKDDRPQLKALMGKLRKGDTLCVVRHLHHVSCYRLLISCQPHFGGVFF